MPDQWKQPTVLHGYKKDNKTDCSTHAEISLLLITFKILLNIPDILIHKLYTWRFYGGQYSLQMSYGTSRRLYSLPKNFKIGQLCNSLPARHRHVTKHFEASGNLQVPATILHFTYTV
jgi:hypothetical protein